MEQRPRKRLGHPSARSFQHSLAGPGPAGFILPAQGLDETGLRRISQQDHEAASGPGEGLRLIFLQWSSYSPFKEPPGPKAAKLPPAPR